MKTKETKERHRERTKYHKETPLGILETRLTQLATGITKRKDKANNNKQHQRDRDKRKKNEREAN